MHYDYVKQLLRYFNIYVCTFVAGFLKLQLGIVGEVDKDSKAYYMWTHKKLDIGYNQDAIVDVNLTSEAKVKLEPGARIAFTYEVCFRFSMCWYTA